MNSFWWIDVEVELTKWNFISCGKMCNHRWAWPIARETFSPDTNHDGCPNPFFRGGLSLLFAKCQQASVEARKRLSLVRGERRGKGIDSRPGVSIVSPHPGRPLCVLSINLRQITFPLKPLERKKKSFALSILTQRLERERKTFFHSIILSENFLGSSCGKKKFFCCSRHSSLGNDWKLISPLFFALPEPR